MIEAHKKAIHASLIILGMPVTEGNENQMCAIIATFLRFKASDYEKRGLEGDAAFLMTLVQELVQP